MHPAISDHLPEIAAICRKYGLKRMDIFGSAARGTDFDPDRSDADFMIEVDREVARFTITEYCALQAELEALLGREVDLTEEGTVRNPYILRTIEQHRENVYAA